MRKLTVIGLLACAALVACGGADDEPITVFVFQVDPRMPDESYYNRINALQGLGVIPISVRCGKFELDRVRNPNEPPFIHPGGVTPYLLYFSLPESSAGKVATLPWFEAPLSPQWEQLLVAPTACGPLPESIRF